MYAVIFRSTRTEDANDQYNECSNKLEAAVQNSPGYISHFGFRHPATREGVTIAYFETLEAIAAWRENAEHSIARELGRESFYENYSVHVTKVERHYSWNRSENEDK